MHSATSLHAFQTRSLCAVALITGLGLGLPATAQSQADTRLKSGSAISRALRLPETLSANPAQADQHHDERGFDFSPALTKSRLPAPPSINGSLGGDMKFTLRLRGHGLSLGLHSEF